MHIPGAVLLGNTSTYDADSGEFINGNFQRIAELIDDFNPELKLMWIPPKERTAANTRPYGVAHYPSNGNAPYMIMLVAEEDLNHKLIAKLWTMQKNTPRIEDYLDAENRAAEALRLKDKLDEQEERKDRARSLFRSEKNYYQLSKDKVLHL